MFDFLVRRLLATIPVLGMVALFVFFMLRLTPGDPAAILAGDNGEPHQIEAIRESLGLNEPIPTQLFIWSMTSVFRLSSSFEISSMACKLFCC